MKPSNRCVCLCHLVVFVLGLLDTTFEQITNVFSCTADVKLYANQLKGGGDFNVTRPLIG